MNREQAEEFTEALGQIAVGGWRQAALGEKLGVPQALGLTTREWVEERLGGYLKLNVTHRREAVAELAAEGMTIRQSAAVLGVGIGTVARDRVPNGTDGERVAALELKVAPARVPNGTPIRETPCPTCHGVGWIPIEGGSNGK